MEDDYVRKMSDEVDMEGEKWNFEVCRIRLSFIKVTKSVTHVSIYSIGSFPEKLP